MPSSRGNLGPTVGPRRQIGSLDEQGRPFCQIKIHKRDGRALVDTGADISVMSERYFRKLRGQTQLRLDAGVETLPECTSASGDLFASIGRVTLRFQLGSRVFKHPFLVLTGLTKPIIIGSDFLREQGAIIDFHEHTLRIGAMTVPMLKPGQSRNEVRLIRCTRRTVVQSQHITVLQGRAAKGTPPGLYVVSMLETAPGLMDQPGVSIPNTVVEVPLSGKIRLTVFNETTATHALSKGAALCVAQPIAAADIQAPREGAPPGHATVAGVETQGPSQNAKLRQLIDRYSHIFAETDLELGTTDLVEMKIDTDSHPPIRQKPYRIPYLKQPIVEKHINDMLQAEVIRPSTSPWASPIVLVPKKDGSLRFCVDYRKVNNVTTPNSYPLPCIDDILAAFCGAKVFSKMDLKSGYWQIQMDPKDRQKTAFITHLGLFEFNKMPFGLANAPSVFQDLMNTVLQGVQHKYVMAYLDDLIVFSKNPEQHVQQLEEVFERLSQAGLKLKLSKCEFFKDELKFLGHTISSQGIQPDFDKVRVIKEMAPPQTVRDVRAFIGMASYYRRYVKYFAEIAHPLVALTKKTRKI